MKKPTTLRTLIFALALLFNFVSQAQSGIAFNSKLTPSSNGNLFLNASNQLENPFSLNADPEKRAESPLAAMVNPAIKYAQSPYLGTVSICPNDGKELPKLFLCGSNETRNIETGLVNPQSIIWEKFIAGGSCLNVSNTNCANETADASCWTQVGNTVNYLAHEAGQFRVRIVDNTGTPYTYYFNVYQNTLDPGAIAKNHIIRYGNSCTLNGKITVNGFGSDYEYGITTTSSPPTSWQSSNVFNITAAGNYNVFIRLSGVAGSCDFKVPNIVITTTNFAVTTQITSSKCSSEKGSITVTASDTNLQYVFKLSGPTNITVPATKNPVYTFTGLNPGTYTLETTLVEGPTCMKDTKTNLVIENAPDVLKNTSTETITLTNCVAGRITGSASGGKTPYRYSVNIDNTGFVNVANVNNYIAVAKSGSYLVRVEDGNGCTADITIPIAAVDKPTYSVSKADGSCTGSSGSITVNVTDTKGYTDIRYSINNGSTFVTTNNFPGLASGIYYVVVQYRKSGVGSGNNNNGYCTDPAIMTTVGAATPLTASAGIAALSGCGPSGSTNQGLARIANAQGGVPFPGPFPYKYSFMGSAWQDSNEMYINPGGPYTFRVMDAVGCIYEMKDIKLDQKPAPPSIKILDPVFNCDGSATTTVEVNGGVPDPKYSYKYYIDGFLNDNTPSNVFLNVGSGKHTITVEYTVTAVSTYSNLLIENFGSGGTTTTPGIAGTYCFNDQRVNSPYVCGTRSVEDNQYSVTSFFWRSDDPNADNSGAWFHFKDHTTNPNNQDGVGDANGRYLLVNIGEAAGDYGVLYSMPIVDVIPNQPVMIDLYVANLLRRSRGGAAPILIFELVDENGIVVATDKTGKIAEGEYDADRNKWIQKSLSLNPGNNTKLTFKIRSGSIQYNGNDLVIDDIWVRQIPRTCGTVQDFDINVDGTKAFSASITGVKDVLCTGDKNGELTINAQNFDPKKGFQYSVDGGNWVTVVPSPASSKGSVTLKNLVVKNYQIRVRYENKASSCTLPFSQDISEPERLTVTASVTKPATCLLGATITAIADKGTPGYKYELRAANGTTVLVPFQDSGEFTNVAVGSYTVVAIDNNQCQTSVPAKVTVVAAVKPTAAFGTVSPCFDASVGTNIPVTVTGGVGPYTYTVKYNGGTPSLASPPFNGPSFTYKANDAGTYVFKVTDSYGCETGEISVTIKAQLLTSTNVTTGLDCDPAPNNRAVITGSIQGGTAPYVVSITSGATTGTLVQPVANGTSFTYTIGTSGLYKFQIRDANNCLVTSEATIAPLNAITLGSNNTNPKCNGGSTGSVELLPGGGSGGFTYSRDNITFNNNSVITGLQAGNYTFYVKDSNKCTQSINVTLTDPPVVVASANFTANTTCSASTLVTVSGAGGVGGFTYSFNGSTTYTTTNTLTVNLTSSAQTITYSVKDSNNCTDTKTITVPAYNPPTLINFSTPAAITCSSTSTSVTLTTTGGVSPLTYSIVSGPTTAASNTTGNFTGLVSGTYVFEVKDANGCTKQGSLPISPAATISAAQSSTDVKCVGFTDGTATFTVTGASSTGNFTYTITPASGTAVQTGDVVKVTGLTNGSYTFQAKDRTTGCSTNSVVAIVKAATAINFTVQATKINCKETKATISFPTLSGGTPGYTYAFVEAGTPAPAASAYSSSTTVDTAVLTRNIDVYVKDTNGCTPAKQSITIGQETPPQINTPAAQCYTGTPISVTISGTVVGTPTYSIDNVTYGPSATFSLGVGSHTLYIKDGFGCVAQTSYTVARQLTLTAVPAADVTCTPNTTIDLTANGGTGTYTYAVSTNGTAGPFNPTSAQYVATAAGTYTFRVTDSATPACVAYSAPVVVTVKATTLTISTSKTDVKCFGDLTGVINITATSGKAPFTYSVTKGGIAVSTTATTTGLGFGTYDILVTDDLGCSSAPTSVTITEPTDLVASASFPANTACSSSTVLTVAGNGGSGGYKYSFNGNTTYTTTSTLTVNLTSSVQTITYSVQDSNGCTDTKTINIPAYNPPTGITFSAPAAITCEVGKTTTSVTLTPRSGTGVAPFTYLMTSGTGAGTSNTNGIFSGLTAGNYGFEITDANGCKATGSITIDGPKTIAVSGQKTDVKCVGQTNGTATFTVTGASSVGNFTYVLTPASGTVTKVNDEVRVTGLAAGNYKLQVRDIATNCLSNEASVTISPATAITITAATASNVNCGNSISNIVVTATGGVPNYKYAYVVRGAGMPAAAAFSNTNTTINTGATQSNLFWDVYVMDQNDCTAGPFNLDIIRDASPTVKSPAPATFCFKAPSSTSIDLSTFFNLGTGTHTYTVNGLAVTNPTGYNITASGTYNIVVKDANACTATATYIINPELTITATRVKDLTCDNDAEITFTANGGSNTYSTYEVQFNGAGAWSAVTSPFTTPNYGTYQFRVTDNANCQALSNIITITQKTAPTFAHNEKNPTCIGANDGVINITNPTGLAPFTYLITRGATTVSTTATASNLIAGVYDVVLTDAKGCKFTAQITLNDPSPLTATVNSTPLACNTDNTTKQATITVTLPSGGTGTGYEYSFNGGAFSSTATYSTSASGSVTVVMRDSNKCTQALATQTFAALNAPTITSVSGSLITCKTGQSTSNVDITVSNGVGTLAYVIVSGPTTTNTTGATNGKFTGLPAGNYVFKVTDANGCSDVENYEVKPLVSIAATLASQNDVACNAGNTGSASITVSAYSTTYTATLTAGTGTVTIAGNTVNVTGLVAGSYTLRVTDDLTDCFKDVNFTITQPAVVTLIEASNKNANCDQPLSKVSVTAGGGKLPYSYVFRSTTGTPAPGDYILNKNTADLDPTITTWYAWVRDANGCEQSLPITIAKDPDAVVDLPAQQCFTGSPFDIILSGAGTGTLTFTVNGAVATSPYTIRAAGTYKLGVKDANGCTNFKDYVVEKQIFADAVRDKDLTCSAPMGSVITVTIINGTGPFSYQVYDGTTTVGPLVTGVATNTFTETFTTPGNYNFLVTDAKGCPVRTNGVLLTPTGTVVANPSTIDANCNASSDGSVTFSPSGGKAPYRISFDGSTLDYTTSFGGLAAGTYNYTIVDARGCTNVGTITINEPSAIVGTYLPHDIKCDANVPGAIEITNVANGVGPFIYTLYDKTNAAIHTSAATTNRTYVFPNNLVFGDYTVSIVDVNGCQTISPKLRISTEPRLKFLPVNISGTCTAGATVDLFLDPTFPSAPDYIYSIVGNPASVSAPTASTSYQFTGLNFGQTYFFQVQDNNACVSVLEVAIPKLSTIDITAVTTNDVSCNSTPALSNGSVNATASNYDSGATHLRFEVVDQLSNTSFLPPIAFNVPTNYPNPVSYGFTGLPAGSYTLVVKEIGGTECSSSITFEIKQPIQPVSVSVVSQTKDNCNIDAKVTVKGTGGTGPYQYTFVRDGDPEPTAGYSSTNPLTLNYEAGTDWDIWVKDANGCTAKVDVTIEKDLAPTLKAGPAVPCFTGASFTVDLSQYFDVTVGTPIYTLDGVDLTSSIATITTAKTYTIGVRDANGCTATAPYVVREVLNLAVTAKKELDCKSPAPNGGVTVQAEGGITTPPSYTYTITAGPTINTTGATTGIFTDLGAGNYTFEVSDGTCTATTTATIDALIPIVTNRIVGTPLCVGDAANVEINATGGKGAYTYGKGAVPTLSTQTNNIFTQTAAEGTVTYYVKDSNDCVETIDVTVTDPTPLVVTNIDRVQMLCGGGNLPSLAKITVTATGGAGGFVYSFDNGNTFRNDNFLETTTAGTYNVIVKDANGCTTVAQPAVIDALDPPVISGFTKSQMTCPGLTSDVTILTSNGIGTLTYVIVSGPVTTNHTGDATGIYTGLTAGDYVFRVTDANNCTDEDLFTVPALPTLQMQEQVVANVDCIGNATGSATFTASDFTASGAFTYSVVTVPAALTYTDSKVGDVVTLANLVSGHYEVTFTDNTTLCTVTKSVDISQPAAALSITATASDVHCNESVSQLTMSPLGGTPTYRYSIVQSGAAIGTYSTGTSIDTATLTNGVATANGLGMTWLVDVHIIDSNNCTAMTTVTITKQDLPTVTAPTLASNQCTANGNYTFTVTGTGVGPLSFSINGTDYFEGTANAYEFTVPAPTTASQAYTVSVKDANGCIATSTTSTTVYKPLKLDVVLDKEITCVAMPITAAQFTLTAADGNPAYTYEVNINNGGFNTITSPYTSSITGTYIFRVTDSNTCQVTSEEIKVDPPVNPSFTTVKADVKCNGGNTGTITVTPSGGVGPYTFALSGATPANNTGDSTGLYTGVEDGSYTIVVTDSYGCTSGVTPAIVINEPAQLTASVNTLPVNSTCSTSTVITVVANGGTPTATGGYYYNFNNQGYSDVNTYTVNINGTVPTVVTYTVKDANGCETGAQTETVDPLNPPTDLDFTPTAITCKTGENVSTVSVKATNGVGALTFTIIATNTATAPALFGPVNTLDSSVAASFSGLLPGDYTFEVRDSNGCTYQEAMTIDNVIPIAIVGELVSDISCNPADGPTNNGVAKYTVAGFSSTGNYDVTVTTVPGALTYTLTQTGDVITLSNLLAGTYTVTVLDRTTGCSKDDSVVITTPVAISFNTASTKVFCSRDESEITVSSPAGGTGIYSYAVVKFGDPAPALGAYTSNNILKVDTNLTDLRWNVYVKDSNNCYNFTTVDVIYNVAPSINPPAPQCYTGSDLTVDLSPLTTTYNGTKAYTLDGSPLATSIVTITGPGTYKLGIKDDNGCEAFVNYTIENQLFVNATLGKDLYCSGTVDATIDVVVTDGIGALSTQMYTGVWPTGTPVGAPYTTATFTANVSAAGDYYFVTTDSNAAACNAVSTPVKVNTPLPAIITGTPVTQPILCIGGSAVMQVNVDASTGLEPYTYTVTRTGPTTALPVVQVSNNVFTGLIAGTYDVTVTDAKGCISLVTTMSINEPTQLTASVAPFPVNNTCSVATVITVVANGGTPTATGGYYYNFNNQGYSDVNTYTVNSNGSVQTVTYTVKDANGCETGGQTVTVDPLNPPSDLDFIPTAITCKPGEDVSTVSVKATNGVGRLTFTIIGTNTTTSPTLFGPVNTNDSTIAASFPGLLPGDYTFEVKDNNGCVYQELMTINNVVPIATDGQLIAGVACKGEANGKVTFTVSGFGAAGFTPTITGVSGSGVVTPVGTDKFELTNLVTGNYRIDVVDNTTGCIAGITVFVPEPETLGVKYDPIKNANCTDGYKVKATAFDGTPGYVYAFVKAGDPVIYDTADTAELDKAFTWTLWAKDSHDCEVSMPITMVVDASPVIASAVATQCPSATGTYDITVTATGFSADLEYSLDGNTWQLNNNVFTVTQTGDYTVYVRDANKCVTTFSPVTILEPLKLLYDITTVPTCLTANGEVTLHATGGTNNYEYSINGTTYVASNVFNNLAPGNYTFYVKDQGTPCIKTVDVNIEMPNTTIDFSLTPTKAICNGQSNGTITVNMATPTTTVNNNPVYTYSISPSPVGMVLEGNVFKNLPVGSYRVTVTSGKGCPVFQDINVEEPLPISVPTPVVANYGCTTGNATIYATITVPLPTGGSDDYRKYQFIKNGTEIVYEGGSNVYTQTDFTGGKFIVNVFDTNNCIGTSTEVEILPFVGMDKIDLAITPVTCTNDESIIVTVKDENDNVFTTPLEYSVVGASGTVFNQQNTTGLFTLPIGRYLISVRNPATGCIISLDHFVNEPNTFELTAQNVTNVTCFGGTGSVDLVLVDNLPVPTNDAGEFNYTITDSLGNVVTTGTSDAAGKASITGLLAGTYNVAARLTGIPYCDVTTNFTIQQPVSELKIFETHGPISCDPGNDGRIVIYADGGWPGAYKYELVGVSAGYTDQSEFTGLSAGTYTLNVQDLGGCVATMTVQLDNPTPITATATATATTLDCFGANNGIITVSAVTGGQGSNYAYILNMLSLDPVVSKASQDSPIFTGLGSGRYSVTIVDQLNCAATTAEVTINDPAEIVATLEQATGITCQTDATLTLSAVGGTGTYEYSADQNFTTVLGTLPATFPVGVGNHQYYVRDSNGCIGSVSNNVTIDPLTPLDLDVDLSNAIVYCKGSSTAIIDAVATGGLTNYSYTLYQNGVLIRPAQANGYFDLLPQGKYVVRVDSGDCQYDSAEISIDEPAEALNVIHTKTDATCFGANDGKIVITATGGTGVIKYAISPNLAMFDDKFVFDRLSPGVYEILVQDENSCVEHLTITIEQPNVLEGKIVGPIVQEICDGDNDGSFTIQVSGGRPPYSVSLDNENGTYMPVDASNQYTFTNLKGGEHSVYIKDATCLVVLQVNMDKAVILNPTTEVTYDCVNNAQSNMVVVTVDASNTNPADVDYSLDNSGIFQPSNIFTNVAPGPHYIVARHTNGCEKQTRSFTIDAVAEVGLVDVTDSSKDINVLQVKAFGGIAPYEYSFNGEPFSSSNTYRIYKTGDYPVTVRDKNGCEATIIVHGIFYDFCMPNYFTPNGSGTNTTIGPDCGALAYKELTFDIYDRYGRVVAKYHVGQKWDGKYNGNELPTGDYWYVLKLNDPKDPREFVGHFTLYR